MMAFEDKKKKAIALMEDKKMWRSNYAPPILRLFWKMGVNATATVCPLLAEYAVLRRLVWPAMGPSYVVW